jgi:hypothetical protein
VEEKEGSHHRGNREHNSFQEEGILLHNLNCLC